MALLQIRGVSKTFRTLRALDGVDIDVQAGTFHGLIGPNGSGKSTLLKAIAGAHFADTGTIVFEGRDITRATPYERARAGLSLKFQLATQSGESLTRLLLSSSRRALDGEVSGLLERFRLIDRADDLAAELSHGEQQWLEIAMALALKPKLLLLDEPTGGMSPEERHVTGKLLEPIKAHCALIIVEHDLHFIRDICDQLTVLDQGKVLDQGDVEAIQRSARVQQVFTTRV
jgi:ABC-type uncharacterized transport system ATPase subunit